MKKILFVSCVFFFGCAPDLPIEFWIEDNWEDDETEVIINSMKSWEDAVGIDVFDYRGRIGSEYSNRNYRNWQHVVYKILSPTEELNRKIEKIKEKFNMDDVRAFSRRNGDVVYLYYTLNHNPELDDELILNSEYTLRDLYLYNLQDVIMHEFGHIFGMSHNNEDSIMNLNRTSSFPGKPRIREYDINEFYEIYDC